MTRHQLWISFGAWKTVVPWLYQLKQKTLLCKETFSTSYSSWTEHKLAMFWFTVQGSANSHLHFQRCCLVNNITGQDMTAVAHPSRVLSLLTPSLTATSHASCASSLPSVCELKHCEFPEMKLRQDILFHWSAFINSCTATSFLLHYSRSWLIHSIVLCSVHEWRRYIPVVLYHTDTHKLQKVSFSLFLCSSSVIESCTDKFLNINLHQESHNCFQGLYWSCLWPVVVPLTMPWLPLGHPWHASSLWLLHWSGSWWKCCWLLKPWGSGSCHTNSGLERDHSPVLPVPAGLYLLPRISP